MIDLMNLDLIKEKIKSGINTGAEKFLSAKVKDELGLSRPSLDTLQTLSQGTDLQGDLNTFFKPVNSTFLSSKDYKVIKTWSLTAIAVVCGILVLLFFSLILPHKDYSNVLDGSQVIVKGISLNGGKKEKTPEEKIINAEIERETDRREDLRVENVAVEKPQDKEDLAQSSPLLKSKASSSGVSEHIIKSGETLEKIALKYYNSLSPEYIQKIKTANKINNSRYLRVGQRLIIPM